jgi:putative peptide zinc metalloprotease protein
MTIDLKHDLIQSVEIIQVEKHKFALHGNDKIFFVGEMLFDIFRLRKEGDEIFQIHEKLQQKYNVFPSIDKISEVLEQNLSKIFKGASLKNPESKSTYIYGQVRVIPEHILSTISNTLQILFNRYIFATVLILSGYSTFLLVNTVYNRGLFNSHITLKDGIILFIISYVFLFFVSIFHELGHSSAAAHFGVRSKEVGFGFYLIFPVLYTDVTKIWLLNRYKRIVVNVGGIYFQMIINIVLYFVFWFFKEYQNIIAALFLTNSTLALYSLNPIMRNDGYWIYSDFFDIPNLSKTAFDYPVRAYQYLKGKKPTFHTEGIIGRSQKIAIFVYALVIYTLLFLLPIGFTKVSIYNYKEIVKFIHNYNQLKGIELTEQILHISKLILFYSLATYIVKRMVKGMIAKIKGL